MNSDNRYLACFVSTKSEIVVPIFKNGKLVGEIDIDSHQISAFKEDDEVFLEKLSKLITNIF